MALSAAKPVVKLNGSPFPASIGYAQKGGTTVFAGGLVSVATDGYARPARTSTTDRVVGYALQNPVAQDSSKYVSTSDGDTNVIVAAGVIKLANSSAGDAIAQADVWNYCYVVDDATVAKTDGTGTRVRAGRIIGVDAGGVFVLVGLNMTAIDGVTLTGSETLTNKELTAPVITAPVMSGLKSASQGDATFVANDCALTLAGANSGGCYQINTTAGASTVSLTAGAGCTVGSYWFFTADGTKNGHTVTYRDGATAISAAATASKRHLCLVMYDGAKFVSNLVVGP